MPELHSRRMYMERYALSRARRLRSRITEHRPPVVVFYSLSYVPWWREVAGVGLTEVLIESVKSYSGQDEHTLFIVVPQPAHRAKGKGNNYYVQVGKAIGTALASGQSQSNS